MAGILFFAANIQENRHMYSLRAIRYQIDALQQRVALSSPSPASPGKFCEECGEAVCGHQSAALHALRGQICGLHPRGGRQVPPEHFHGPPQISRALHRWHSSPANTLHCGQLAPLGGGTRLPLRILPVASPWVAKPATLSSPGSTRTPPELPLLAPPGKSVILGTAFHQRRVS